MNTLWYARKDLVFVPVLELSGTFTHPKKVQSFLVKVRKYWNADTATGEKWAISHKQLDFEYIEF